MRCDQAWNISVKLDKKKANSMYAENHISDQDRIRRTVRFGIQGSGIKYEAKHQWKNWTDVTNWVCSYQPILSTVIFDCIPENQAPGWWKQPLMGPAFPSGNTKYFSVANSNSRYSNNLSCIKASYLRDGRRCEGAEVSWLQWRSLLLQ